MANNHPNNQTKDISCKETLSLVTKQNPQQNTESGGELNESLKGDKIKRAVQ